MYYRVRFEILGKSPNEENLTEVFRKDDRVISARTEVQEATRIKFEVPQDLVSEKEGMGPNLSDMDYDGSVEPGWGQLFFETPEEYEPETVVELFDETTDEIDAPLALLYIDANSETFSEE